MLVTSRSFAEYQAMFGLDKQALSGTVLDCCAGASSFVAELTDRGGAGVAIDTAYALSRTELEAAAKQGLGDGSRIIDHYGDRFTWDWYGTPERRDEMRRTATARFLADFDQRPDNYIAGALPTLPFDDNSHDLVICSHLLFTWSTDFDADWHHAAISDMCRVARREVRVYPLVVKATGERVPFFDDLIEHLRADGHQIEIRHVPYVFQRGADSVLIAKRPGRSPIHDLGRHHDGHRSRLGRGDAI